MRRSIKAARHSRQARGLFFEKYEGNSGCFEEVAAVAFCRWQDAVGVQAFKDQGVAPFQTLIAADLPQRGVAAGDVFVCGDNVPVVVLKSTREVIKMALHRRGYDESGRSRSSFTYRVSACAYVYQRSGGANMMPP